MNRQTIEVVCRELRSSILQKKDDFISVLIEVESYKTATSELSKTDNCLENIGKQINYLAGGAKGSLCIYMPMNQPLYSLILFAVIPSFMFEKVYFRPPSIIPNVYRKLEKLLSIENIICITENRQNFLKNYVFNVDTVIYTGKYENAIDVLSSTKGGKMFLLQGSGANPVVITKTAFINNELMQKIVDSQIYNSGQDCMAPAAIFIAEEKFSLFLAALIDIVKKLKVSSHDDENADVSPLLKTDVLKYFLKNKHSMDIEVLLEGYIDIDKNIMSPYILRYINIDDIPSTSMFAPIFCLYSFSDKNEIERYLLRADYQENKAYISIFGENDLNLTGEIVIEDDVLSSIDDGYSEFGGFGKRSGFISINGSISYRPILISREIYMARIASDDFCSVGDLDNPFYEATKALMRTDIKDKKILEIGCGTGPHAQYLASQCKEYIAVDIDGARIKDAAKTISHDNLFFVKMDATDLLFDNESFDVIYMFHCLHEVIIENQDKILEEAFRVLKKDGHLIIIDAVSEPVSAFQKCFDVVHKGLFNVEHMHGVLKSEGILADNIDSGKFKQVWIELLKETFEFENIEALLLCLRKSFAYEIEWHDGNILCLVDLITEKYGHAFAKGSVCMEEHIILRHLVKGKAND